jgi:hypothetical protein
MTQSIMYAPNHRPSPFATGNSPHLTKIPQFPIVVFSFILVLELAVVRGDDAPPPPAPPLPRHLSRN